METKEIQKAIEEFDIISSILNLEDEILNEPLKDTVFKCNNETYYFNNIEEIKRFYINEICDVEYTGLAFGENSNHKILRARIESLLNTLYLVTVSLYIIEILTEFIYNGFQETNNQ